MTKFKVGDKARTANILSWYKPYRDVEVEVLEVRDSPGGNQYLTALAPDGYHLKGVSTEFENIEQPGEDAVNPDHYSGDLVMRVIEERGLDFALGNAVKYLCRAGSKPGASRKQDLLKAQWYLNRAIEKEESSTD